MMMFLAPSSINFIAADNSVITGRLDDRTLDLGCQRVLEQNGRESERIDDSAKIQAVKKDGHWFTLNNASLQVYQRLEMDGKCRKVKVDVVSMRSVPMDIRRMMVVPRVKPVCCASIVAAQETKRVVIPAKSSPECTPTTTDDRLAVSLDSVHIENSNVDPNPAERTATTPSEVNHVETFVSQGNTNTLISL